MRIKKYTTQHTAGESCPRRESLSAPTDLPACPEGNPVRLYNKILKNRVGTDLGTLATTLPCPQAGSSPRPSLTGVCPIRLHSL